MKDRIRQALSSKYGSTCRIIGIKPLAKHVVVGLNIKYLYRFKYS